MKAYKKSRYVAPLILIHCTNWRSVVTITLQPLYCLGKETYTHWIEGLLSSRLDLNILERIRTKDQPARSVSSFPATLPYFQNSMCVVYINCSNAASQDFLFFLILGLLLWAAPLQRAHWIATVKGKTGCAWPSKTIREAMKSWKVSIGQNNVKNLVHSSKLNSQ